MPSLDEIGQVVILFWKLCQCIFAMLFLIFLEKKNDTLFEQVFKFRQWTFYILLLYPLKKGWAFYLNKIESPFPINALCQVWFNRLSRSEEEDGNVKT